MIFFFFLNSSKRFGTLCVLGRLYFCWYDRMILTKWDIVGNRFNDTKFNANDQVTAEIRRD